MTTATMPFDLNPPRLPVGWRHHWRNVPTYDYIRANGCTPPTWTRDQVEQWEDRCTDYLILVRRTWDLHTYEKATRWLLRHRLDHAGRWRPGLAQ
ncbi:hypothetical protein EOT10_04410 [Streptomyces antnestii]|uniref:Uncharacterized protein n=1 Tax=Streptomyces antnestii TaxID=2494256 RepID=A0A3S2VJP5_9ACTN|nr:hypothetical protein [Streptomyces sp. San01]RVU29070.1 hypothetical protein EOT10_04410 [Streptomyces sp. San01]